MTRRGRRPGNPDTRNAILAAARGAFAANGFSATSIRAIAGAAGVDPALIHHYFGSKDALFLATVEIPVDIGSVVDAIIAGPRDTLGLRLATTVLGVWESPAGLGFAAALKSAITDPAIARMVREFLSNSIIYRILRGIDCPAAEVELRGALVASQVAGVVIGRHVLQIEPLASIPTATLAPRVGATLQRYLTGPLPAH